LRALPRIYQVTPDIPDRRRATKHKEVRLSPADSLKESQLAAGRDHLLHVRRHRQAQSEQQASKRKCERLRGVARPVAQEARRGSGPDGLLKFSHTSECVYLVWHLGLPELIFGEPEFCKRLIGTTDVDEQMGASLTKQTSVSVGVSECREELD
jgi:hypothetical protein